MLQNPLISVIRNVFTLFIDNVLPYITASPDRSRGE